MRPARKPAEAGDGSYAGAVLDAFDRLPSPPVVVLPAQRPWAAIVGPHDVWWCGERSTFDVWLDAQMFREQHAGAT